MFMVQYTRRGGGGKHTVRSDNSGGKEAHVLEAVLLGALGTDDALLGGGV